MRRPYRTLEPVGIGRQARHATVGQFPGMGDTQTESMVLHPNLNTEEFSLYNKIPAQYVISVDLAGDDAAVGANNTQLRPEPFVLLRISWCTTADVYPALPMDSQGGAQSIAGRSVEMTWGDEFTKFMGQKSGLISSVLGDSNGFLDLPAPALFQGSQPLTMNIKRLFWPADDEENPRITTRWDFVFTGVGLLPKGVNESGSAG